jgi:transcriptional regulator with XRE-family HTH domain
MPKFTDQLRKLFADSGYTQAELRKATGLDRATISRFVSGERFLSPKHLDAVAEFLGWTAIREKKR